MKIEKIKAAIRMVLVEKQPVVVPEYLNRNAAAKYVDASPSFIQRMKEEGKLKYYQPISGGTVRYTAQHLDAFMKRREKTSRR